MGKIKYFAPPAGHLWLSTARGESDIPFSDNLLEF
jgi:hypothetical protein